MSNEKFEKFFNNKDFTLLEKMKPEFHKEYYVRTGYFQGLRDQFEKDEVLSLLNLVQRVTGESDFEWQDDDYKKKMTDLETKLMALYNEKE